MIWDKLDSIGINSNFTLQGAVHPAIPVIIFGIFSCTAGVFALMLPETLNKRMPETVADVEKSAKG